LNNERDNVTGNEYPEVDSRAEDRGFTAEYLDEAAKEYVYSCCVECGSWAATIDLVNGNSFWYQVN
jgi:hypothetical protein